MNFSKTHSYHLILGALTTAALTLSVMPSAVSAEKNSHRLLRFQHTKAKNNNNNVHIRQLSNTTDTAAASQYCTIGMEALLQLPNETQMMDDEIFTCTMDNFETIQSEEGDIFTEGNATSDSTMLYELDLDEDEKKVLKNLSKKGKIKSGQTKLDIQGLGQDKKKGKIHIPKGWDCAKKISNKKTLPWEDDGSVSSNGKNNGKDKGKGKNNNNKNKDKPNQRRDLTFVDDLSEEDTSYSSFAFDTNHRNLRSGTKKVLVVKVIDKNGLARPESPAQMSADVFGPITGTATASITDNVLIGEC